MLSLPCDGSSRHNKLIYFDKSIENITFVPPSVEGPPVNLSHIHNTCRHTIKKKKKKRSGGV